MIYPNATPHRRVTVTPPKLPTAPELGLALEAIDTIAYVRTSTRMDEQHESYEAQMAYYTRLIKENDKYRFAGIYADEKSGLVEKTAMAFSG